MPRKGQKQSQAAKDKIGAARARKTLSIDGVVHLRCTGCLAWKPEAEFSGRVRLASRCKSCLLPKALAWQAANRALIAERARKRYHQHCLADAHCKAYERECRRDERRLRRLAQTRQWCQEHRSEIAARRKLWRAENRDLANQRRREAAARYYAGHSEMFRSKAKTERVGLSDRYLRCLLGLPMSAIDPQLLDMKREQINLHRAIRALTTAIKEKRHGK